MPCLGGVGESIGGQLLECEPHRRAGDAVLVDQLSRARNSIAGLDAVRWTRTNCDTELSYRKQIRPVVEDGATAMDWIFGHASA